MGDQKLLTIHHVPFLVDNFSTKPKKPEIFRKSFWVYFDYSSLKAWFFRIY